MRQQQPALLLAVAAVALCCLTQSADASRALRQACGSEGAACGLSLKTACNPAGLGYCAPGLFCGWKRSDTDKTTTCMRIPKDAGKINGPCMPGNAQAPLSSNSSSPVGKPWGTCSDANAYCIFTDVGRGGVPVPAYAVAVGDFLGTCRAVASDCGASGKACCPSLYHLSHNPQLPESIQKRGLCSGTAMCKTDPTPPGGSYWLTGTCVDNKPGCGEFGKGCCIQTTSVTTNMRCGVNYWEAGPKGYCAYPEGKSTGDLRDMLCSPCPPPATVAADKSNKYFGCPSS